MSWIVDGRTVAEPTGAKVTASPALGGAQIDIELSLRLVEWPWKEKGPISVMPQPADIIVRTRSAELHVGKGIPASKSLIIPPSHSSTDAIRYTLALSSAQLAALEGARDGGDLQLEMQLVANIAYSGEFRLRVGPINATVDTYQFQVPRDQWAAALQSAGYCETLITELRLPTTGPDSTAESRKRFASSIEARNKGSYGEAMRRCRLAIDELKKAGFGGKAPADVAKFLQEKSGTMSQSERFSALQVALWVFLSPAHHANAPEEEYSREDAELAIAMLAALLRLAPRWHVDNEK